jgi:hypothetical protein
MSPRKIKNQARLKPDFVCRVVLTAASDGLGFNHVEAQPGKAEEE